MSDVLEFRLEHLERGDSHDIGRKEILFDFSAQNILLTMKSMLFSNSQYEYKMSECELVVSEIGGEYVYHLITPDFNKLLPQGVLKNYSQKEKAFSKNVLKKFQNNNLLNSGESTSLLCHSIRFLNKNKEEPISTQAHIQLTRKSIKFTSTIKNHKWPDDHHFDSSFYFAFPAGEKHSSYSGATRRIKVKDTPIIIDELDGCLIQQSDYSSEIFLKGNFSEVTTGCEIIYFNILNNADSWIVDQLVAFLKKIKILSFSEISEWLENNGHIERGEPEELERLECVHCGGVLVRVDKADPMAFAINTAQAVVKGVSLLSGGGINSPWKTYQGEASHTLKCENCGKIAN